jgi:zinc protease
LSRPIPTLLLLLAAGPVWAQEVPFEQHQLANGLNVILLPDPALPQVVVNLWYDVGSKDEVAGRTGFAHLFEHLMFMGTSRLPGSGFDDRMEAVGGWNNAWTSEDATDYFDVGPAHILPLLLWMEADRMEGLAAAMTAQKVDKQRDVVRNERRQSYEDAPYGEAWIAMPEALYPAGHPYAHSVIGSHADLQAAGVDDVKNFFNTWYVPNNASLVVAGDFDPATVKPLIEQLFGKIPSKTLPARPAPAAVDRPVKALVEVKDQVEQPKTHLLWHTAPAFHAGDAEMDILSQLLSGGMASRLYQRLVEKDNLATEVSAYQMSQKFSSIFLIEALPAEGHTLEEVEAAIMDELSKMAGTGPTAEELERVKNGLEVGFLRELESLHSRATALNRYKFAVGEPGWFTADLARYRSVDAEAIRKAAATLTAERRAIIRVHPEATEGQKR